MLKADGGEMRQPSHLVHPGATVVMDIPQLPFPLAASILINSPYTKLKTSFLFNSVDPIHFHFLVMVMPLPSIFRISLHKTFFWKQEREHFPSWLSGCG